MCYDKIEVASEWLRVGANVCVDSDGADSAPFEVPDSLLVQQIKMVHTSGNVSCSTWNRCGEEGSTCACTGTVRYGSQGQWFYSENVTGSISCNNGVFGDPIVGTHKVCDCRTAAPASG